MRARARRSLATACAVLAAVAACTRPPPEGARGASLPCERGRTFASDATHDDAARYAMPFGRERARRLVRGVGEPTGEPRDDEHVGAERHAFDFAMPIGAAVLAARAGRVVCASGTAVAIRHADGTTALYLHLSAISVALGAVVSDRAPLGASGSHAGIPFLHFSVVRPHGGTIESVPIRFDDGSPDGFVPVAGAYYAGSVPR